MITRYRRVLSLSSLLSLLLSACAETSSSPPPSPPTSPTSPTVSSTGVEESAARHAVEVALSSLSKRNFEVGECDVLNKTIVDEAAARAGAPIGARCTMLVARRADRTWLVAVRPATTAAPVRAGGSLALVTVTAGGEGVAHIDYVR